MSYGIQKREKDAVATGSVFDMANRRNMKLEEIIANAKAIVLIDVSGSMVAHVRDGRSRFDLAIDALRDVQRRFAGDVLVISFHSTHRIELGGVPSGTGGSTNLAGALDYAKQFDGTGMQFIVITDGEPDSEASALSVAATMVDPISTIFIGTDQNTRAIDFLNKLATAKAMGHTELHMLGTTIAGLLGNGE